MGYEVLDGSRTPGRRPEPVGEPPAGDVEVVDLSTDPGRRVAPTRPQPWRLTAPSSAHRRTALIAALALVAGVVTGFWLRGLQAANGPDPSVTARLAVLATASDATPLEIDSGAGTATTRLEVQVLNLGAGAVSVVATPTTGDGPRPGETVTFMPVRASIGPGEVQQVTATVTLDCQDPTDVVPRLSVRTDDGRVHPVVVKDAQLADLSVSAARLCARPPSSQERGLDASVVGTPAAPVLVLRNPTQRDGRIVISSASALRPPPGQALADVNSGELVAALASTETGARARLTASPRIPLTLPAGATVRLKVHLTVQNCASPSALGGAGGLVLAGLPVGDDAVQNWESAYVDLGPALRAALERTCRRDGAPAR